jgi:putative transposase
VIRRRPGPVGVMADDELLAAIRQEIAESPFIGEAQEAPRSPGSARHPDVGQARAAPHPRGGAAGAHAAGPQALQAPARREDHRDGAADTLWATDATEAHTRRDGRCAVFALVDHASGEAWVDASPKMDRWAAADLLREVCTERFGSVDTAVAAGLALRYGGGPCFRSAPYQAEIDFLGISRSPAYHYEPETNGCVEKFNQTLKEEILWIEHFDTIGELRARIRQFAADYRPSWLLERHGYRTPAQARDTLRQAALA